MGPKASIIITTHNRPTLLPRAVASALLQTESDIEVIVIDDGSTPPVRLSQDDDRLMLKRNASPLGVCAARNTGLYAASGQYVAVLDDDDEMPPGAVEAALRATATSLLPPPVAGLGRAKLTQANGSFVVTSLNPSSPRGNAYHLSFPTDSSTPIDRRAFNCMMMPTHTLRAIGGYDEGLLAWEHDDLMIRLNAVSSIESFDEVVLITHEDASTRRHLNYYDQARAIEATYRKHRALQSRDRRRAGKLLATGGIYYLQANRWMDAVRLTTRALIVGRDWYSFLRWIAALSGPLVSTRAYRLFRSKAD